MNVSFRQLRLFLALADEGQISRAAALCHVTQPTASIQLKELTLAIGLPLYEVIGKKVHLTDAGRELARTARAMLGEWTAFEQYGNALKGLSRGTLRVAVVSTAKYFMPRILGTFCARHPEIDIALEVQNRDGVVRLLEDNRVDLAIMSVPPATLEVEREEFLDNPLIAVAPESHPLTRLDLVTLAEFAREPLVLREPGSGTRRTVDRFFNDFGLDPRIRLTLGSNEAIKQAVAGGLGLSILSRHAFIATPETEGLRALAVEGLPILSHWFIVHLSGKRLSPLANAFRDHLRASVAALPRSAAP